MVQQVSAANMAVGATGRIVQIDGGYGLVRKLDAMGIRVGTQIQRLSGQLMRGPIMLRQGNTRLALGLGMARKIWVEIKS